MKLTRRARARFVHATKRLPEWLARGLVVVARGPAGRLFAYCTVTAKLVLTRLWERRRVESRPFRR